MPQERFITTNVLPPELVDRIQRKVRGAYIAVQDDTEQTAVVTVRFVIEANRGSVVDGSYTIQTKLFDKEALEAGKIRDGQLELPGCGLRADDPPPSEAWRDEMLAGSGRGLR